MYFLDASFWIEVLLALGSMLFGAVLFVMFFAAMKRKGRSALLLLPFGLWLCFWNSWGHWRRLAVYDFVYEEWAWVAYDFSERAMPVIVMLPALVLIFKKDKATITPAKPEEPKVV